MDQQAEGRPEVTDTDLYPVIQVITWLLLAAIFLAVVFRILTRLYLTRQYHYDDLFIVVAFILATAQSITLLVPASTIWGRSIADTSARSLNLGLKTQYVGEILFMPCICVSKAVILLGLLFLTPVKLHRRAILSLGALITLYGVTSTFAIAFQCRLPEPWNYVSRDCIDRESLMLYICVLNIVTELCLIFLPIAIIAPLQLPKRKKWSIIALFASRVTVIVALATQVSYLKQSYRSDFTFNNFPYIICTQTVQALSVITACVPYLQPFLESLNTGLLWNGDIQRQGQSLDVYGSQLSSIHRRDYENLESQIYTAGAKVELKTLRDTYETRTAS